MPTQVATANVPFENARGSRAFSDCNKGWPRRAHGSVDGLPPPSADCECALHKRARAARVFGLQGGGGLLCADSATAAEFPLYPVPVRRLRHCRRAERALFKRRILADTDCRPLERYNLASFDGEPVGVNERWRVFSKG